MLQILLSPKGSIWQMVRYIVLECSSYVFKKQAVIKRQSLEDNFFWHSILVLNTSQTSWPSLTLALQIRNHRCIPSSFMMHPESDHAYMMVTTSEQWTACALSPQDPAQVPCKRCVTLSTQCWTWPLSAWCHPNMVKGFWPAQSTGRVCSRLHTAYSVAIHRVESLAATLGSPLPDNFSAYQWSLLGEDFEFKSNKLKLSSKRKVICGDQMRLQTLAFQKSSIKWKNKPLISEKFSSRH